MEYVKWQLKKNPRVRCALIFKMASNHFQIRSDACEVCVYPNFWAKCGRLEESILKDDLVELYYDGIYKVSWPKELTITMTVTGCQHYTTHQATLTYNVSEKVYEGDIEVSWSVEENDDEGGGTSIITYTYNYPVKLHGPFNTTLFYGEDDTEMLHSDFEIFDCATPHFKYQTLTTDIFCGNTDSTITLEIQ